MREIRTHVERHHDRNKRQVIKTEMTPEEYEKKTREKQGAKHKHMLDRIYVDNDGNKFSYAEMCNKVKKVLANKKLRAHDIFKELNMCHTKNVHMLPTMLTQVFLEYERSGGSDTLYYKMASVCMLQELLHPLPNFKIKSVTHVHLK